MVGVAVGVCTGVGVDRGVGVVVAAGAEVGVVWAIKIGMELSASSWQAARLKAESNSVKTMTVRLIMAILCHELDDRQKHWGVLVNLSRNSRYNHRCWRDGRSFPGPVRMG
jgi:hypothetical protein